MTAIRPTTNTYSSRRFNQDASGAKRAAANGPVFITDRGRPAHVLMTIEEYRTLKGNQNIEALLAMPGDDMIEAFDEILEDVRRRSRDDIPPSIDLD